MPITLHRNQPHTCPYIKDQRAREEFATVMRLEGDAYRRLMDLGFRRSGLVLYRPICEDCRQCEPIRVPVDRFSLSRSQRRVLRRNADVDVQVGTPECTEEKWLLYREYLRHQHDGTMSDSFMDFHAFLYSSPMETLEMTYRVGGQLIAAGLVDACDDCLSSVYLFFHPEQARRSMGVFGGLCEIAECRRRGMSYWYIGFCVEGCPRMSYKANFRPHELLGLDGVWRAGAGSDRPTPAAVDSGGPNSDDPECPNKVNP